MSKTEDIIRKLSEQHGIPVTKGLEAVSLYNDLIAKTISSPEKETEDGLLDPTKFKVIRVQHFGKFVPNLNLINMTNNKRLKEKNKHES